MRDPLPITEQAALATRLADLRRAWHLQPEAARRACLQLIDEARSAREPRIQIQAADLYGKIMDHEGQAFAARNVLYEAIQQAQSLHEFGLEARIYEQIGRLHYTQGDYRTALQNWQQAIELAQAEPTTWMLAKVGLGQIYDALGDPASAILLHQAAASRIGEVDDAYLEAKIRINLGVNLQKCQRHSEARQELQRALDLCLGPYPDYAAESLFRLAEIALAENDLPLARQQLESALDLARQVHYQWGEANIYSTLAEVYARQEDWLTALDLIQVGQQIALTNNFNHILMRQHLAAARYAEALFNAPLALAELKDGFAYQQKIIEQAQPEQRAELEMKTGLRPSVSSQLIQLANHHDIEHGSEAEFRQLICTEACSILQLSRASWWLLGEDGLTPLQQHDSLNPDAPLPPALGLAELGAAYAELKANRLLIAHDALHHPEVWTLAERFLHPRQTPSMLALPVRSSHQHCVLLLEHVGEQRNWIPDEIMHAGQIADIALRALNNHERRIFQREIRELNLRLLEANEALEQRVQQRTEELARTNAELQQAMAKLVQSEKLAALGSLVAGIAHELNTPLGAALTCATALHSESDLTRGLFESGNLKKTELDDFLLTAHSSSEIIERNIRRASGLVAQFKQVAVDTDSERRREFGLAELAREVVMMLRPHIDAARVDVQLQLPEDLLLDSYPGPLEQVLSNLLQNSLLHGFGEQGHGQIRMYLAQRDDQQCQLIFEDNGAGIASEHLKRVFDPFFTTRLGQGGSGLGLYIVYNLVTGQLGGELSVSSEVGVYTRFTLTLPLCAPNTQDSIAL
ncbi:ATP-binding protein [Chitinibacter sp. ZOR0017]|uniref:ATP-binding protein n=1 Tax=Chitinibacter sp. ZOR0017 TaxID=1339254 RepID=UPI00068E7307|nr:ATP-binding protein [Chitinibacter sp. ZOR0017]